MRQFNVACDIEVGTVYKVRIGIPLSDSNMYSHAELVVQQVCSQFEPSCLHAVC